TRLMETVSTEPHSQAVRFRSALGSRVWLYITGPALGGISGGLTWVGNGPIASVGGATDGVHVTLASFGALLFCCAVALVVWTLVGVWYAVVDGNLVLKRLWRRRVVPLADIVGVRRVAYRNTWKDPMPDDFALGTNVLWIEIDGADRPIVVSPRDEDRFMTAIGR
ncbi:MAG: hypothetical protein OXS50_12120, partial [Gammaproteobacteria bacterium]|nr:hypothetical protein [Gammaproteobacteria bacterium]